MIDVYVQTLNKYKVDFDSIIHPADIADSSMKPFRDKILKAMGYSNRRSDFYPDYFKEIGIKVCVYCNAHLAITAERNNSKRIAQFQVDHFIPKNKYPGLSVSLYNLYPSCASCNNIKSTDEVDFQLYQPHKKSYSSKFRFILLPGSKAKFLRSRNINDIQYILDEPIPPTGKLSFNEVFSINGIYQTQKDVAEELFMKAEIYNSSYRKILETEFKRLFKSAVNLDRLITGNYTEEKDIHKRPLSKFTMDIGRQIGLIK